MSIKSNDVNSIVIPFDLNNRSPAGFMKDIQSIIRKSTKQLSVNCVQLKSLNKEHIIVLLNIIHSCFSEDVGVYIESASPELIKVMHELGLSRHTKSDVNESTCNNSLLLISGSLIPANPFYDEFKADSSSLQESLNNFERYLVSNNLGNFLRILLYTIYYEITRNILEHSGLDKKDKVSVYAFIEKNRFVLRFIDYGIKFDPSSCPGELDLENVLKNGKHRGIGILLVHRLSSNIRYMRSEQGANILTIEKKWRA